MSSALMEVDLPLDEIVKKHRQKNFNPRRGNQTRRFGPRNASFNSRSRFLPERWERDLHPRASVQGAGDGKILLVSNLSFMVTDEDVHELFSEFGPIKKSFVNYDKAGRSHGTAEIIFFRREDAQSSFQKYNNVQLDGRPMILQFVTRSSQPNRLQRPTQSATRGSSSRGGRFGSKFRGRNSQVVKSKRQSFPRGVITKESLDADLEAYKKITDGDV